MDKQVKVLFILDAGLALIGVVGIVIGRFVLASEPIGITIAKAGSTLLVADVMLLGYAVIAFLIDLALR